MAPTIAPYAAQHKELKGAGDARPTAIQIVQDQGLTGQLQGRKMIVTGCSPLGMGAEIARALHTTGADVYMTVRDEAKGREVADDIVKDGKPGKVEMLIMELGSFASVNAAADRYLSLEKRLDVLVCNAGVMACPEGATEDGFETQFGTNHLGHFLLFQRLKHLMQSSAEPGRASRVVSVASSGHRNCSTFPDDYNLKKAGYTPWRAYGQSKTANIHFANELDRRHGGTIRALSLNPGGIWTPLQRHLPGFRESLEGNPAVTRIMKSVEQGAATAVWAALAKELEGLGGLYLEDCQVSGQVPEGATAQDAGYAPHAFDQAAEERLWRDSLKLVGVSGGL